MQLFVLTHRHDFIPCWSSNKILHVGWLVNLFVGASLLIFDCFAFDSGGLGFAQMSWFRAFQSSNALTSGQTPVGEVTRVTGTCIWMTVCSARESWRSSVTIVRHNTLQRVNIWHNSTPVARPYLSSLIFIWTFQSLCHLRSLTPNFPSLAILKRTTSVLNVNPKVADLYCSRDNETSVISTS
jgi:hypothetical protein